MQQEGHKLCAPVSAGAMGGAHPGQPAFLPAAAALAAQPSEEPSQRSSRSSPPGSFQGDSTYPFTCHLIIPAMLIRTCH